MQKKKCKSKDHGQASCDNAPTRLANKLKRILAAQAPRILPPAAPSV